MSALHLPAAMQQCLQASLAPIMLMTALHNGARLDRHLGPSSRSSALLHRQVVNDAGCDGLWMPGAWATSAHAFRRHCAKQHFCGNRSCDWRTSPGLPAPWALLLQAAACGMMPDQQMAGQARLQHANLTRTSRTTKYVGGHACLSLSASPGRRQRAAASTLTLRHWWRPCRADCMTLSSAWRLHRPCLQSTAVRCQAQSRQPLGRPNCRSETERNINSNFLLFCQSWLRLAHSRQLVRLHCVRYASLPQGFCLSHE